jgi:hypothetical protein
MKPKPEDSGQKVQSLNDHQSHGHEHDPFDIDDLEVDQQCILKK